MDLHAFLQTLVAGEEEEEEEGAADLDQGADLAHRVDTLDRLLVRR